MSNASRYRLALSCALAVLTPMLAGCVAAIAVPALTAAGALTEKNREAAPNAAATAAVATVQPDAAPVAEFRLTPLTELPPPSPATPGLADPWPGFARFALDRASGLAAGADIESALLSAGSAASLQSRRALCAEREPAVLIDLDPGEAIFSPQGLAPAPGAAESLARLREAGVVVLWLSQADANRIDGVAEALRSSGLDPSGRDPILLVRHAEERKQTLRERAGESVCVVAIAGDGRADFDELFEYLRDPAQGMAYDGLIGAGWFIVPPFASAP